jgi:hypothetical protein
MESAEIRSEAAAAALDATVLAALTDRWERVGEVAARVEYWQRPTVRSALWRLMKDGYIDAEQRFLQSGPEHRMHMGYYWVFRRKSSSP